jgi:hypothetical protein
MNHVNQIKRHQATWAAWMIPKERASFCRMRCSEASVILETLTLNVKHFHWNTIGLASKHSCIRHARLLWSEQHEPLWPTAQHARNVIATALFLARSKLDTCGVASSQTTTARQRQVPWGSVLGNHHAPVWPTA